MPRVRCILCHGSQNNNPWENTCATRCNADVLHDVRWRGHTGAAGAIPLAAPAGQDNGARQVRRRRVTICLRLRLEIRHRIRRPPAQKSGIRELKLIRARLVGGTVRESSRASTYCAMADAGYDFIWTEMASGRIVGGSVARLANVPACRGGSRCVAYRRARDPADARRRRARARRADTIDTVEEAREAVKWACFRRSDGAVSAAAMRSVGHVGRVPGGYRSTINDNLVLILMIETLEGLKNADEIAKCRACTRCSPPAATQASRASSRAIRITSALSTSCTTPRSRPAKTLRPVRVERPPVSRASGAKRDRANPARCAGRLEISRTRRRNPGWTMRTQVNNGCALAE